ncbi:MAG: EAL domain-containing protein [Pseudomonadota bacterium]
MLKSSATVDPLAAVAARARREWLVLVCVVCVLTTVATAVLYRERLRIAVEQHDRLAVQTGIVAGQVAYQIDAIDGALNGVRSAPDIFDPADPGHLTSRRLAALTRLVPGIQGLHIMDRDGVVRASTLAARVGQGVADKDFFRAVRDDKAAQGLLQVLPIDSAQGGSPVVALARRLQDDAGGFSGLVCAAVDTQYFSSLLSLVRYASDMGLALVQDNGVVVAATPGDAVGLAPLASFAAGSGAEPDLLAVRSPVSTQSMRFGQKLYVVAGRPWSVVYRGWRDRAILRGSMVALAALTCAGLLNLAQRRRIPRALADAQREAEKRLHAERLDFILGGADVGLWDWDVATRRMDFSPRWYTMLGLSAGEIGGDPEDWLALVHPEDLGGLRTVVGRYGEGEDQVHESEFRMRHKSGHWLWILDRGKVQQRAPDGTPQRIVGAHMDVTQHKRADEALRQSESRFRALTELSSDWFWELDHEHRFVHFEGYSDAEIGMAREDNIGLTRWDLGALNMGEADWARHRAVLDAHEVFHDLELQRLDTTGGVYWVSISGAPVFSPDGRFRGYRGIGRSITERKRVEDEIERLAFYDALTGLPNRRLLLDRLEIALENCRVRGLRGALLFIDLDNFKDLNDTMGHDVGDLLLERVANRVVTCVKSGDTVARLGGDEFVVMLEGLTADEAVAMTDTRLVGERVLSVLNHPYLLDGYHYHSTPSLGIALFDGHVGSVDDLLKRADLAMYQAKAAGRNTLCFFHPDMQKQVIARSALEANLRNAIPNNELLLYYQPVVDAEARLTGAEALLRWRHPVRGMVSPGEFIPLAEQTGLILRIGLWVLETACEQLVEWSLQPETRDLTLAVNVSARQFRQLDFVSGVLAVLERTGARPDRLKIELTESLLLNDVEDIIDKMTALKKHGVGFSLDDFGTGYSSLAYLKRLPLDVLKIDQSFVRDVLTDPNDAAIVRTIITLAESLDLSVVAEGVETAGQLDFLTQNGCRLFQGYLFGRPAPMQAMLSSLQPISVGH